MKDNTIHASSADQITAGIQLDNSEGGLLVNGNTIMLAEYGIESINSPNHPRIVENVVETSDATKSLNLTTQKDWVVSRNWDKNGDDATA